MLRVSYRKESFEKTKIIFGISLLFGGSTLFFRNEEFLLINERIQFLLYLTPFLIPSYSNSTDTSPSIIFVEIKLG